MADSATTPAVKNTVELEADVNVEFNEAASRQQINSGESVKTLFGKLRKFLTDLKAVAFSGAYSDLSGAPESLPADGGNADTVDGYHIRCEDVATPNYNWFVTFDNDGLSGISPSRAYVGNAGNANTANAVKTMSVIGTASDVTHTTVLDWANSINGFGTACIIDAYGYPSDAPVSQEGFLTLKTCYQKLRKIVTFSSYTDNGLIYQRQIWANDWRTDWYQTKAGNADTVNGLHASDFYSSANKPYVSGTAGGWDVPSSGSTVINIIGLGFTPSAVICVFNNGVSTFANPVYDGFDLTITSTSGNWTTYIAFK